MLGLAKALGWFGPYGCSDWFRRLGMLWAEKIPRTIGTTAAIQAVYNRLGGRLAYPHVWVRNWLLVVFSIVSRIINISCDIFGIYRYQHREYRDISIPISCDLSNDIDMMLHVRTSTPQVGYQKVSRVCSFGSRDVSLKQKHQFTNWPQQAPRNLCAAYYTSRLHECTLVRRKGTPGKET